MSSNKINNRDKQVEQLETLLHHCTFIRGSNDNDDDNNLNKHSVIEIPTTLLDDIFHLLEESPQLARELIQDVAESKNDDDDDTIIMNQVLEKTIKNKYSLILPVQFILRHQEAMVENFSELDVMNLCLTFVHLFPDGLLMKDLSLSRFDAINNKESSASSFPHASMSYLFANIIWDWMESMYLRLDKSASINRSFKNKLSFSSFSLSGEKPNWRSMKRNHSTKLTKAKFHELLEPLTRYTKYDDMSDIGSECLVIDTILPLASCSLSLDLKFLLKILSQLFVRDEDEFISGGDYVDSTNIDQLDDVLDTIIMTVTSIPSFVKTLLFLSAEDRAEVFGLNFVKRVVLEGGHVSTWIAHLLKHDTRKALWYFRFLSLYLDDNINSLMNYADNVNDDNLPTVHL